MTTRKWLRAVVIGGALLFAASAVFSRALRASAAHRYLTARLTASFGRPVEVSWFDFSLLDGGRIEAHFVSVADDPHFGNEYFLRADTLAAGLRWTALLAGRFEFGSVSLSRPSLNLARDAEGRWNIDSWLPPALPLPARPGFAGSVASSSGARASRPSQIDVDAGRINFKQGYNKSPFALIDVSGRVRQTGAGRWQLDLEARPMRAGVELQDIGTLRLRGSIAGTTARLQPAEINLTWRDASVADALRLVREYDYGMRGQISLDLNARIAPPVSSSMVDSDVGAAQWSVSATARFTGMHGWRLPPRDNDPAANLSVDANWQLGARHVAIRKLLVEMPASRLQGAGTVDWSHGLQPQFHLESSTLALADALSWYRSLVPAVAEDLRAEGFLGVDLKVAGWPVQLQQGAFTGSGGTLTAKSLPAPLRIGSLNGAVSHGGIVFAPAEISFSSAAAGAARDGKSAAAAPRNSLVLRGSLVPPSNGRIQWPPDWIFSMEGETSRLQDWLALSQLLALPLNSGWSASGGVAVKLRASRLANLPPSSWTVSWIGTMDFLGISMSPAYINQPVRIPKAHVDFTPAQRTVTISAAEAFGASWHGSISRKPSDSQWAFDLSADRLNAADLDRWLGPRARPGFLALITGSRSNVSAAPLDGDVITRLSARGRLRVGVIDVPPMQMNQFDADVELAGRAIQIRKAQADFYGGKISGTFDARLLPDPSYVFEGRLDRVNLAQLSRAASFLNDRIGGSVSATLTLSAHGVGRQNLIASMQGQGTLAGRNDSVRGLSLYAEYSADDPYKLPEVFASVAGNFRIQNKGIDLTDFVFENSRGRLEAEGRIDFSHALNLRFQPSLSQAAQAPGSTAAPGYQLGGTLEAPKLIFPPAATKPVTRSASR